MAWVWIRESESWALLAADNSGEIVAKVRPWSGVYVSDKFPGREWISAEAAKAAVMREMKNGS